MQEIAAQWSVDWKPDLSTLDGGVKGGDPQRLGAIAGGPPPAAEPEYKEEDVHALPTVGKGGQAPGGPSPAGSGGGGGGGLVSAARVDERKDSEMRVDVAQPSKPSKSADVPSFSDMSVPFSPHTLGSIAQRPPPAASSPASVAPSSLSSPSNAASYPGTLNIILLQGRDLPQATTALAKTVVKISEPSASSWHWMSLPALPQHGAGPTLFPGGQHCPLSISSPTTLIVVEVLHQYGAGVGDEVVGGLSIEAEQMRRSGVEGTFYTLFSPHSHAPRGQVLLASQYMPLTAELGSGRGEEPVYHSPQQMGEAAPSEGEPPAYEGGREGEMAVPLVREDAQARSAAAGRGKISDLQARLNQLG